MLKINSMLLLFLKAKVVAIVTGAGTLNGLAGHFHRARGRPVLAPRPGLPRNHLTIICPTLVQITFKYNKYKQIIYAERYKEWFIWLGSQTEDYGLEKGI